MHNRPKTFTINKPLKEFSGDSLIIGCGKDKVHQFSLSGSDSIHTDELHPPKKFYHLSLNADYSDEGKPDLEGDFLDEDVFNYLSLSEKKFDLICFEVVTELFSDSAESKSLEHALGYAKSLLSKNGLCFIYFGGRELDDLNQAIAQFKYSYSFVYGALQNTWSMIASDSDFDLDECMKKHAYLDYMGKNVLMKKSSLTISYNIEEKLLGKHIKSESSADIELLDKINPFASCKLLLFHKKMTAELKPESEDDEEIKEQAKNNKYSPPSM